MKKLNKKGFTIVELVIVIAVIAILAAVLIPTFSNVVKKANYSNDIQVARNMETSLAVEHVGDNKVEDIVKAKEILTQEGYANNFIPKSSGYHYYWCEVDNYVYLVYDKDNAFNVAFPETKTEVTKDNSYRLDLEYYKITCDIEGITSNKKVVVQGTATCEITLIANTGYTLPNNVTVTGATKDSYESTTGVVTVSKITGNITIKESAVELVTLTFIHSNSHSTLSYNGTNYAYEESFSFKVAKNSVVSITGAGTQVSTLTVYGKTVTQTASSWWIALWTPVSDGTIITEDTTINSSSCILSGSKVTLADGSTKLIDDITTEDKLMTFNFYEGKIDGNYPMYVMKHENVFANVITVTLDNKTVLEMCDWQQFFDMDEKTYFDIDAVNYKEAIGRNIMLIENGAVTTAKITNATKEVRVCTSYEIFTEYNKNFVANSILTVEPETYLQGVYTIKDDLKIDMEQYQKDVNTYGRYTYEEFSDIMTEDEFIKMNIADKKIAVKKGVVSEEWLISLYKNWTPLYR